MNPLDAPMQDASQPFISPWPTILKYGSIGAGLLIIIGLVSFLLTPQMDGYLKGVIVSYGSSLVSLVIYILIMIFSILYYRDKLSNGYISLGQGMLVSYGSAMVMGLGSFLFSMLYLFVIDPGYSKRLFEKQYGAFTSGETLTPDLSDMYTTQMIFATQFGGFIFGCFVGVILALIISAILKKSRPF